MFGDSRKETALWTIGMLVAAGIPILGALYVVNTFIAPHDPTDPLIVQVASNLSRLPHWQSKAASASGNSSLAATLFRRNRISFCHR